MGPLEYLTLCSLRNRVLVRLRRLKQPRYLIGLVVGLAYFGTVFVFPRLSVSRGESSELTSAQSVLHSAIELGGAAFLFLLCATAWIPVGRGPALVFSQADVHFLFPAPLTRRELLRYKLLRPQIGVVIGSLFMTLIFNPWSLATSWMFFLGIALMLNIFNIYMTGVSLRRESLGSHGIAGVTHQWLPLVAVLAAVVIVGGAVILDWSTLSSLPGREVLAELSRLTSTGAAGVVMWPFRTLMRLPTATNPLEFFRALPGVMLLLVLSYVWVIRSDAKFEEASAAIAAEIAEKVSRIRKGQRMSAPKARAGTATPFNLAPEGRAEMAIFWKNLILLGRYLSFRTLLRLLPIILVFAVFSRTRAGGGAGAFFAWICAMTFVFSILLGPLVARSDLRRDLIHLSLLKTWPVDGATLVRGEIMAPAALLTAIAWLSAVGMLVFQTGLDISPSWIVAAALVAPGVIVLRLLEQNAVAVMFPSWVVTGPSRSFGIDVLGQRILMMLGLLVVLVVAVVPAAILGGIVGMGLYYLTGSIGIVIPAALVAIVLFAEAYVASQIIGRLLDRTDVSAVDAPEN